MDIPKREEEGRCPGTEEATLEAEEFVACGDEVHARGAAAEGDVASGEAHLIEIVEVKVAVAEADAGEHGVVLAVGAVGSDVEEGALSALRLEDFCGGLGAEEEVCFWEDRGNGLDFVQDLGGAVVWDSHDQGGGFVAGRLFLAEGKDCSTGGVREGVSVAEIGVAIFEGMERKEVKRAVGDED